MMSSGSISTTRGLGSMLALSLLVVGAAGACGGASPQTKTAENSTSTTGPAPAVNPQGQTVGIGGGDQGLTGDAKDAYDRGFSAWVSGDLPGAKVAFNEASNKASKSAAPKYSLGSVLERLGDTQGALDAYRAAYNLNPKFEPAIGAYALLLARTGHGPDAEQFLNDRKSQSPDSVALLTYAAEVKSLEGDSPGCQSLAQAALKKQPDYKDAMVVIARDYYRNHRWDLARYALQAILDGSDDGSIPPRDKTNPEALLLRALIARDMGQRKDAIAGFEQAIAKRPDLFEAYVNLGEMKLEAGNATEAQAPLEKAVKFAPNVAVAHLDLGDCYRLLGRPGDAKKEFDTALTMDSTLAGVHYNLGLLYLFSPAVPGSSGQDDQLVKAIQELETFKSMRGAKSLKGPGDDVDELLSTAKRKQGEVQMKKQAAATAAAAPPASSAGPAGSGAPAGSSPPAGSSAPAPAPPKK